MCDWKPSPNRLIISHLRSLLEDQGGSIEEIALADDDLQTGLLKQLLSSGEELRQAHLSWILEHHWSEILRVMRANVFPLGAEILQTELALAAGVVDNAVARFHPNYRPNDTEQTAQMTLAVNSYLSTQSVEGWHLATGHVFRFEERYWICLSPLCDLEPSQNADKRWDGNLGGAMPFKAVQLVDLKSATALKYATTNVCLFLRMREGIRCFGFVDVGGSQGEPNPHWEQMFASSRGRFEPRPEGETEPTIEISAVRASGGMPALTPFQRVPIVAQLKYEYALNLLQRLGGNLSRIGLDHLKKI